MRQVTCQIPSHPQRAPARTPGARKGSWTNGKGARSLSSSRGRIGVVPLILTTRGASGQVLWHRRLRGEVLCFRGPTPSHGPRYPLQHAPLFLSRFFSSSFFFLQVVYRFLFRCSVHSHRGCFRLAVGIESRLCCKPLAVTGLSVDGSIVPGAKDSHENKRGSTRAIDNDSDAAMESCLCPYCTCGTHKPSVGTLYAMMSARHGAVTGTHYTFSQESRSITAIR